MTRPRSTAAAVITMSLLLSGAAQTHSTSSLDQPVLRQAPLPQAGELMREVQQQLPRQALDLLGFIQTRDRTTREKIVRGLRTELRFGKSPPHAVYHLLEGDQLLESLRVDWTPNETILEHRNADGTLSSAPPEPSARVSDTGITWSDLSLDFLWWPGGETVGRDSIKTRGCFIVELPQPENPQNTLRVWIDEKARFVVKASLRDEKGTELKKIEVDSIKEIEKDRWMVKDLEIRDYANDRKTLIRIETVIDRDAPDEIPINVE